MELRATAKQFREHWRLALDRGGQVATNSGWILTEKALRAVAAALVSAWVARYLGPDQYGKIAFVMALTIFLMPFAQFGSNAIVLRDLSRNPPGAGTTIGSAVTLRLIAGVAAYLLANVFIVLSGATAELRLVATLVACQLVFQAGETGALWFQSRLESRIGARLRICVTLAIAGLKIAFILLALPLAWFALAVALESALIGVLLLIAARRQGGAPAWQVSGARIGAIMRASLPFLASGIAIAVYMRIDQILLRQFLGEGSLGRYAAVVMLAQALHMVPLSLLASLAPGVAKARGTENYHKVLRRMFISVAALALAMAFAMVAAAPLLVNLLLGDSYAEAVPALRIYAFTTVAVATGSAWNVWAANENRGALVILNTIAGASVAIATNLVLIPWLGLVGAAIAANLGFFTSALLVNAISCPKIFLMQLGIGKKTGEEERAE